MFDMFFNLVSDDTVASAMISLAEKFQCTPIEMLSTGLIFLCISVLVSGLLFVSIIDRLVDKACVLLEKLCPLLVKFIVSTLTALYLFLRRKLNR